MGELYKMTQFKDKTAKVIANNGTEYIPTGLFTYPILMAADILLYNPRYVPVGIDQKQHVELARNIAERFNNKFGKTFKVPEALISEVGAKIMDLVNPEIKMSKSSENGKGTIFLLDAIDDAKKKIMSAKTDSLGKVKYDVKNQPGISNLIVIYSCITKKSIKEIEKKYNNITNYGIFKKDVADAIALFLTNFQKKYNQIIKNKNAMLKELKEAAKKCIKNTENVVNDVYKKIGLNK
jgi:tryptophanyl-tRNA synthetase